MKVIGRLFRLPQAKAPDEDSSFSELDPSEARRGPLRASRRPSSMFRGSELPRLLFLVAIVLAGGPMIVLFARSEGGTTSPRPDNYRRPRSGRSCPDEGIEFQALVDKKPIQAREGSLAAYGELLRRARETSPAELSASSGARDILYTHLWERPKLYRGVPVHIQRGPPSGY